MSVEQIKNLYGQLGQEAQDEVIRFVLGQHPGRRLKQILGRTVNEPAFDEDLSDAIFGGEHQLRELGKVEVKDDYKVSETGNVAIEFEYRGQPSGITTSEADFWLIWLEGAEFVREVGIIIKRDRLRTLAEGLGHIVCGGDNGWSEMYLITLCELLAKNSDIPVPLLAAHKTDF